MTTHEQWLQVYIEIPSSEVDSLSDFLSEDLGALAITLNPVEDNPPQFQRQPGEMPLWDNIIVVALFTADTNPHWIIEQLPNSKIIQYEWLDDKNWIHETQKNFQALCFSNLWVIPSWDKKDYPDPKIRIDPGLAFGTGTHATTSLCLQWLADHSLTDHTVIDFGCGSGILSLAACALGAKAVYAVDHDEQAILATKQNTALNSGFEFRLQIGMESILPFDLKADVVIANILADPLITLYPQLLKHTRAGGILVLSGLLENDYSRIVACYETDFRLIECQQKEEWLRLTFKQCDLTGD